MSRGDPMRPGAATTRRSVLIGIGLTALAACTPAGGPSGRREVAQGNQRPTNPPSEGGIGGTGIIGILADADRPLINGLRLSPPPGLTLRDPFGAPSRSGLALGQALTVEAIRDDAGALLVRAVTLVDPLVGPVEAVTGDGFRCLGVAVAIPSAPGFVGPYQLAFVEVLERFGVDGATALAMGALVWFVFWISFVGNGVAVLRFGGISLAEITRAPGKDPTTARR